jgi:hypothetical protein
VGGEHAPAKVVECSLRDLDPEWADRGGCVVGAVVAVASVLASSAGAAMQGAAISAALSRLAAAQTADWIVLRIDRASTGLITVNFAMAFMSAPR